MILFMDEYVFGMGVRAIFARGGGGGEAFA